MLETLVGNAPVALFEYRVAPDGQITLRMYIIADGGITMANYKRQLALFSLSAAKLPDYVYGE